MILDCINSIQDQNLDDYEIFVVDNASIDGTVDKLIESYPQVNIIANKENVGFAAANNQAIKICNGEYILLLNGDTLLFKDTLDKVFNFFGTDKQIGIVGCKLLNTDGSLQPSVTSFPGVIKDTVAIFLKGSLFRNTPFTRKLMTFLGKVFGVNVSRFDDKLVTKEIDFPRGAFFVIKRELYNTIGLLDKDYFFTGEEMDYCYRAKKAGWKVMYFPDAEIIHHDHGSSKQMMGKVFVQTRKSALLFYQKHYSRIKVESMKFMVSVVLLIKICLNMIMMFFRLKYKKLYLAKIETYFSIIKVHYLSQFRKLNVFTEMPFKYN